MEEHSRLIDLKQFFIFLLHRWFIVLIVAIVFAAGMVGYSYRKNASGHPTGSISDIIEQNQTAWYQGTNVAIYTDGDAPEGTYNSRVRLYVDFDTSAYESYENLDLNSINTAFQRDFQTLAVSYDLMEEVIEELDLRSYDDMSTITGENLRWMVNRNFEGTHIFNLVVTDVDPERAQTIATALAEKLIDRAGDYIQLQRIRVLDAATVEPVKNTAAGIGTKSILKYGAVGFVGGLIVAAVIYLIVFIGKDVVMSRSDVEYAGTTLFGVVSRKNKEEEYKKLAACLRVDDIQTIVIAPVDRACDVQELVDNVQNNLIELESNVQILTGKNIHDYADIVSIASDRDAVILVAKKEKSTVENVVEAVSLMKRVRANVLGVVLI